MESIGFPSVTALLREVPGVEVVKPSDNSLVMVYLRKKKEEEGRCEEVEKERGKTDSRNKTSTDDKVTCFSQGNESTVFNLSVKSHFLALQETYM